MIIIGIDPGSRKTGFGIIERSGNRMRIIDFGVVAPRATLPLCDRLPLIYDSLRDVVKKHAPDESAIEEVFFSKNPKAALVLGQARGVAMLALKKSGLPVYEYAARKVKQGITGNGAASKDQVQFMVRKLFRFGDGPLPEDAADALAIAVCHSNMIPFRRKLAQ